MEEACLTDPRDRPDEFPHFSEDPAPGANGERIISVKFFDAQTVYHFDNSQCCTEDERFGIGIIDSIFDWPFSGINLSHPVLAEPRMDH